MDRKVWDSELGKSSKHNANGYSKSHIHYMEKQALHRGDINIGVKKEIVGRN